MTARVLRLRGLRRLSDVAVTENQATTTNFALTTAPVLVHAQTTLYDRAATGSIEPGETFDLDEPPTNAGLARRDRHHRRLSLHYQARHYDHAGELGLSGHRSERRRPRMDALRGSASSSLALRPAPRVQADA